VPKVDVQALKSVLAGEFEATGVAAIGLLGKAAAELPKL
jgi:hypothetical protein